LLQKTHDEYFFKEHSCYLGSNKKSFQEKIEDFYQKHKILKTVIKRREKIMMYKMNDL
jgi:hypothetical protein